jgi:PEP-CTERM motif-containing protein
MNRLNLRAKCGLLRSASVLILCFGPATLPVVADTFSFSTGNPDGKLATLSRPPSGAGIQTETADDFILSDLTLITNATFTGLIPVDTPLNNITQVEVEFYHVFPADSANPPSGKVPTRMNSPADVEIDEATRDSAAGTLTFSPSVLSSSFTAGNSIVNGINPSPNQHTGGEGAKTGEEVQISVSFNPGVLLPADHYFFRPEALLSSGNFLLLSAPKPIVTPGTPFNPDLQSWIRNDDLAPDWLRTGADIVGDATFNATFSLTGQTVPEPATVALFGAGMGAVLILGLRRRRSTLR